MPEIGTSGLMSGDGKRGDGQRPKPPRPSSTLPFVYHVAALLGLWKKDYERWAHEADRALSLNPNYGHAHLARGLVHVYSGEPVKGIPYIEQAMRLDPAQQQYRHFLGTAYLVAGNFETAAAILKERVEITPTTDLSRALLASALGHLGRAEEGPPNLARAYGDQSTILLLRPFWPTAV